MSNARTPENRVNDPVLLVEAVLAVILIALFVFLYVIPTETRLSGMRWWAPLLLGGLLFSLLALDARRRKRRSRRLVQRIIEDQRGDS
jgi:uncharacterized integral membrane protein